VITESGAIFPKPTSRSVFLFSPWFMESFTKNEGPMTNGLKRKFRMRFGKILSNYQVIRNKIYNNINRLYGCEIFY
jgi:hypothetical protein